MKLSIWRNTDHHDLFPVPYSEHSNLSEIENIFKLMGLLVARCILDNRIMQLRLSPVFWKVILGKPLDTFDFIQLDYKLANSTFNLQVFSLFLIIEIRSWGFVFIFLTARVWNEFNSWRTHHLGHCPKSRPLSTTNYTNLSLPKYFTASQSICHWFFFSKY